MSELRGIVTGDAAVIARFGQVVPSIRAEMVKTLGGVGFEMVGYIRAEKLSGQVLHRRTGQLSNSVTNKVVEGPETVSAVVGANTPYAGIHEYGFSGTVMVSAHSRMVTMVFGKRVSPREIFVRAHSARMNLPERSYMRTGLRDRAPDAIEKMRATVAAGAGRIP
jgi:phage gpG-like protein